MAHNFTHLKAAVNKARDMAESVLEAKQEAIDNCESDSRLEKLETQLEVIQGILDTMEEAVGQLDDYES